MHVEDWSLCPNALHAMKVVLLIRSLEIGGTERQVVELARGLKAQGVDLLVLTFYPGGTLRPQIEAAGVAIDDLGKRGRWNVLRFVLRLAQTLRRERPEVLYSFLPMANILSAVMKPLVPDMRVLWGVRASNMDLSRYDRLSRWSSAIEVALSRFADCIVANSQAGQRYCIEKGFPRDRMRVIVNGVDCEQYRFDLAGRVRVRKQWSIGDGEFLVGISARLDPMKGYETFLQAAVICRRDGRPFRFVCVGDGPGRYRKHLHEMHADLGLRGFVIWAGDRDDMTAVYSALDVLCSASLAEGFSNSIAEAMACERVCVVTDVGDSAAIVGEAGIVVPANDPPALAGAIGRVQAWSAEERHETGLQARLCVEHNASLARLVQQTCHALREC